MGLGIGAHRRKRPEREANSTESDTQEGVAGRKGGGTGREMNVEEGGTERRRERNIPGGIRDFIVFRGTVSEGVNQGVDSLGVPGNG
jgi:hypothetical protein